MINVGARADNIEIIAGDEQTFKFEIRDSQSLQPIDLTTFRTIKLFLYPFGDAPNPVLEIEGSVFPDNKTTVFFYIKSNATVTLHGIYQHQISLVDGVGKEFRPIYGNINIIPSSDIKLDTGSENSGEYLDYLEASGTQWIDTGVVLPETDDFQIEVEYQATQIADAKYVYGADNGSYANNLFGVIRNYKNLDIANRITSNPINDVEITSIQFDTWYSITQRRNGVTVDGVDYSYPYPEQQAFPINPVYLFCTNRNGVASALDDGRIRRFTVRLDDGTRLADLRPYRTEDNIVCMKDIVSGELHLNQGSGRFPGQLFNADTVADMKGLNVIAGDYIKTKGFYTVGDGGGAEYLVASAGEANEASVIALDNGTFANIQATYSMNVTQFGAVPSREVSASVQIKAAGDSGAKVINFPKNEEFLITTQLFLGGDKSYNGNGSTLILKDGFELTHFAAEGRILNIYRVDNVVVDALNVKSEQTYNTFEDETNYTARRLVGVQYANNITIKNCVFETPEAAYNEDGTAKFAAFTGIDLYSNLENVTVENCKVYLKVDAFVGGGIAVRDLWGEGTKDIFIKNNYFYNNGHDETVSLGMPNAILENIYVEGNEVVSPDGLISSSTFNVVILDYAVASAKNIYFRNNVVTGDNVYAIIRISPVSSDTVYIENNTFNHKRGHGDAGGGVNDVDGYAILREHTDLTSVCRFNNNIVNVDNSSIRQTPIIFSGPQFEVDTNTVTINGNVVETLFEIPTAINNIVECTGNIEELFRNTTNAIENKLTMNAVGTTYFRYFNHIYNGISKNSNNIINAPNSDGARTSLVQSTGGSVVEGATLNVENNNITTTAVSGNYLYAFWTAQPELIANFTGNTVNGAGVLTAFPNRTGLDETKVTITD